MRDTAVSDYGNAQGSPDGLILLQ